MQAPHEESGLVGHRTAGDGEVRAEEADRRVV